MDILTLAETPSWQWPEDAGQKILATLTDSSATEEVRALAAEMAGDLVVLDANIANELLNIVSDSKAAASLRASAAIALGPVLELCDTDGFDDPDDVPIDEPTFTRIRQTLRGVYLDTRAPDEVRRRALEASVRAPDDWHTEAVTAAYRSKDDAWKLTAVFAMDHIDGFENEVLQALHHENPEIKAEAVRAAGSWQIDAAWANIVDVLRAKSTPKDLLITAIEAAVYIRPDEAQDLLLDFTRSKDEEIADAASTAIEIAQNVWGDDDDDDEDWDEEE